MKRVLFALVLAAVPACQKASDAVAEKQMPKLPPPPKDKVAVPAAISIAVEVDGQAAPAIDAAKLNATKADFEDSERRAWRLSTLIGAKATRPGAVAAVTGEKDVTIVLKQPKSGRDPLPVLAQSRRGGFVAAMVMSDDPFPQYHGQGRRLQRPGDPLPRVDGVTRIRVYLEK